MRTLLNEPFVIVAITLAIYAGAQALQRRTGLTLLHPVLVSITAIMVFLIATGVDYETYWKGGVYIDFWLKPAVVALGVPLYRQLSTIRKQWGPILLAELAGCVAGVLSVLVVARLMGAPDDVAMSLVPKSVTTPIAMEVSRTIGGIQALTAATVVCTGVFGAMAGFVMLRLSHVSSPMAQGLAIGTASHAVGTAAALQVSGRYGAFSSVGLTLNALLTAALTPAILSLVRF